MSAPVRLRPTAHEGQFADDAGRLWVRDDRRQPGSQQPRMHVYACSVCGDQAAPVAYLRHYRPAQSEAPVIACTNCVEVMQPSAPMLREYDGCQLIVQERARQIAEEGWTPEHDDRHELGELVDAAICYARLARGADPARVRDEWPWDHSSFKPSTNAERDLVKAAALIAAEIDRLQRAEDADRTAWLEAEMTDARPWETPRVKDMAQTADGRAYRHIVRFETTLGRPLERYDGGGCNIVYLGQFGERTCYVTTWFDWCAKAVREGGCYLRAEEPRR